MKDTEYDIFVNNKIYPKAENLFSVRVKDIEKVKSNSIIVIDTNALLVPYLTGSESLSELEKVFKKLIKEKRLIIPAQVAREFVKNRPTKLKEIFQQLTRKQSSIQSLKIGNYPLLEGIKEYSEASELEENINQQLNAYRKKIGKLIAQVKAWQWDDPVSNIYHKLFKGNIIYELTQKREEIEEQLRYRYIHKIPPGYKDDSKPDEGIGDLLIWLTILELGSKLKKDLIFVSGDEKADWFHISEKKSLYPRFELVNEYNLASNGKSFQIIKLSSLLTLFDADEKVVKEIAKEERYTSSSHSKFREFASKAEGSIFNYILQRDDLSVKPNNGFPDFIVTYDEGDIVGVEVIPMREGRDSGYIMMRMRDRIYRAYYDMNEKEFNEFQFYFVYPTPEFDLISANRHILRLKENFNTKLIRMKFIIGYLSKEEEFINVG